MNRIDNSWEYSSCYGAQEILSTTNPSSSSSTSLSSAPKLISFENSSTLLDIVPTNSDNCDPDVLDDELAKEYYSSSNLTVINFSSSSSNNNNKVCTQRTTVQARDHVVAERKRRENLSQLFIGLSKVVPGLKKLDKASVLEDAIDHLKELQERVRVLEEEMSVTNFINTPTNDYYSSSSNEDKFTENSNSGRASSESGAAEIKARINSDNQHVLINIQCKKQKGLMSRVPRQLEKMHLSVVDMRIMPFGGQALLHITLLAQMQSEFSGTLKDIVEHLQQRLFVHPQQQDKPC